MEPTRSPKHNQSATLESLLRLKRFEQPSDEFWSGFDRELEKRRLQAMVKRDSWYRRVLSALLVRPHPSLLLGTASALVLGLFLFHTGSENSAGGGNLEDSTTMADANKPVVNKTLSLSATELGMAHSGYAVATRHPARISITEADFGVDVIMQRPENQPLRSFRMDLEPATYAVPQDKSAAYFSESLSLKSQSVSIPMGSSSY